LKEVSERLRKSLEKGYQSRVINVERLSEYNSLTSVKKLTTSLL
jgi:hypothetical protein